MSISLINFTVLFGQSASVSRDGIIRTENHGKILFGYQKQFKVLKKQEKAQQGADTGPEKHIWTFIHLLFAEASS